MGKKIWISITVVVSILILVILANLTGFAVIGGFDDPEVSGVQFPDYPGDEPVITPSCGDGSCDSVEDSVSCPIDCPIVELCGDGICNATIGENNVTCVEDCPIVELCGDGICNATIGENNVTCVEDCPIVELCGDGICNATIGENNVTCVEDCGVDAEDSSTVTFSTGSDSGEESVSSTSDEEESMGGLEDYSGMRYYAWSAGGECIIIFEEGEDECSPGDKYEDVQISPDETGQATETTNVAELLLRVLFGFPS